MNDIFLSESLIFREFSFEKCRRTNNSKGARNFYLGYMINGNGKIVSDEGTLDIEEGDVFYIPKGLSYNSHWFAEGEVRFKSLGFRFFPESDEKNFVLQKIDCDDKLKEKICAITTDTPTDSRLLSVFYSVLTELLPFMKYETRNCKMKIVQKARRFIYNNPDCKVADIAKYCMISESALYDVFKSEGGMTPNGLKQQIFCEKAAVMLTSTDKSVQEISDSLGFSSTSYFRKVFRRYMGQTPREMRKNIEKM